LVIRIFFWLLFIIIKSFLTKIRCCIKSTCKKLQKGTQGVVGFKQEQEEVSVVFNNSIEKMSSVVKKTISDSTAQTDYWVVSSIQKINKENLVEGNSLVENTLYKQFVISHLTKKN
jgi:predicted PurR-regulated permease PerM